jgi:hypothetical protein
LLSLLAGAVACSSRPTPPTGFAGGSSATATGRLYVLNQSGDARVADFFSCILGGNSNFNALTNSYNEGESLEWGGQVQRNDNPCTSDVGSQSFFQCAVEAGQFDVRASDVVLVIYPNSGGYGGENGQAPVTNPVDGRTVTIQTAYVASSPDWIYQTIYGMHEVFEAATDGVSADCCNGETSDGGPFPWCPGCGSWAEGDGACGKYATGGTVGSLSITTIKCSTGTFYYQQVSEQGHEYDGTCRELYLAGGSDDPCANVSRANNGMYCGTSRQSGFGGGATDMLYTCKDGVTKDTQSCPDGCFLAAPGQPDGCNSAPVDPCASVSPANDGVYCGASRESGFAGGATDTLYSCGGGKTVQQAPCAAGCYVAPPGTPDACNPDPCTNVASANNGYYCGKSNENGFGGGYANELYACKDGKTVGTQVCLDTCQQSPPGQPDSCVTASSDGGAG